MWWDESEPLATADAVNFKTTHWSVVVRAGQEEATDSAAALEKLCRTYWPPIYAFIRRKGHDVHAAQDLTQSFFAALLEKKQIGIVDPRRGRFRNFLLGSATHFLANDWKHARAQSALRRELEGRVVSAAARAIVPSLVKAAAWPTVAAVAGAVPNERLERVRSGGEVVGAEEAEEEVAVVVAVAGAWVAEVVVMVRSLMLVQC